MDDQVWRSGGDMERRERLEQLSKTTNNLNEERNMFPRPGRDEN
jgi:hypothetical protein